MLYFVLFTFLEFLDAYLQTVLPIRHLEVVGLLNLGLVEHAVMRTLGRRWIFLCVERLYMTTRDSGYAMDSLCEIVPADDTLIREMVDSGTMPLLTAVIMTAARSAA